MNFRHSLTCVLLLLFANATLAHELRPSIVSVFFQTDAIHLEVETNLEAVLAGIGPEHDNTDDAPNAQQYRALRAQPAATLAQEFAAFAAQYARGQTLRIGDAEVQWRYTRVEIPAIGDERLARTSRLFFSAEYPSLASGREVVWQSAPQYGDAVVNLVNAQGDKQSFWLTAGQAGPAISLQELNLQRGFKAVFSDYAYLGFVHIIPRGLDHILFVLGLFLLSRRLGPLLWQVTAFTIAHSITLAMSIYGLVALPSSIVEPLIALSIAYVGLENLLTRQLKPWRVVLVFLFGLLHGLGFAGVLIDLGLPETEFVLALIAFNLGVEAGQIAIILLALVAVFWLRHRDSLYRHTVVIPGSLMIMLMGLYWTWERVASSIV